MLLAVSEKQPEEKEMSGDQATPESAWWSYGEDEKQQKCGFLRWWPKKKQKKTQIDIIGSLEAKEIYSYITRGQKHKSSQLSGWPACFKTWYIMKIST